MKLLILEGFSKIPNNTGKSYSVLRLLEEAKKIDVETVRTNKYDISFEFNDDGPAIKVQGRDIKEFSHIIFRTNFASINFGFSFIGIAKANGVRILNSDSYSMILGDYSKLSQMAILANNGIRIPETYVYGSAERLLKTCNKDKYILKPNQGTFGEDIEVAHQITCEYILEKYWSENILVQEKLPNKVDFRVLVLNGKALGIMQRKAPEEQLVTNYSSGGVVSAIKNRKLEDIAIKAAGALKCEYAGVDIMFSKKDEPLILEVNRNAQFEGFEKVVDVNVAESLIKHLTKE